MLSNTVYCSGISDVNLDSFQLVAWWKFAHPPRLAEKRPGNSYIPPIIRPRSPNGALFKFPKDFSVSYHVNRRLGLSMRRQPFGYWARRNPQGSGRTGRAYRATPAAGWERRGTRKDPAR